MSEVIQLHNDGSRASILLSQGFNCFMFESATDEGTFYVVWAEADHASGQCRPSGGGIPLLFPFPGRIAGARFTWHGTEYELEPADGRGNAIHGFVYNRPWRLLEQSARHASAEFHASIDAPDVLQRWPSDFRIRASYRLAGARLRCDVEVANVGEAPMPAEFGAHPYLQLPAGNQTLVGLPVASHWELADMLPTGACHPLDDVQQVQQGQPFYSLTLDDVFGDLVYDGDVCRAWLEATGGSRIELAFGRPFREIVVYTPGHRESICIEPYSCVPAAMDLGARAGWTPLPPGETRQFWFELAST